MQRASSGVVTADIIARVEEYSGLKLGDDCALPKLEVEGGTFTRAAGTLAKGSNLYHSTGGNSDAFLKLHRRTGDSI